MVIKKKMQEMVELKKMRENQGEEERRTMEKADTVMEKHQKVIAVSQNILRVWNFMPKILHVLIFDWQPRPTYWLGLTGL